jgi:hypothetical protein
MSEMKLSDEAVIAATQDWLVKAVIGLNLCPFARAVYAGGRIRYAVSRAQELQRLVATDEAETETTLLIHPDVLGDFGDYVEFLEIADELVAEFGYEGVLQVASFHPQYQFEGTAADDIGNFTNRSPYPTLHLLRESSVGRAVAVHPDTERIYRDNIETLRRIGREGWDRLDIGRPAPEK